MNAPADASGVEFVMDTVVEQQWYGAGAQETYDGILSFLREQEKNLSLYQAQSEIAKLNEMAGIAPVKLSRDTYDLLKTALFYSEQTGGLFDVTIAPLVTLWDVTAEHPRVPSKEEIEAAKELVGFRNVLLDDENQTAMLLKKGMAVDLGGIAKGRAAGMTRDLAKEHGASGFLSLGGNLMVEGKKPDQKDFVMGIRDPRGDQSDYVATVTLDGYTMATTGDYERYFEEDGVRYHHVIDPFTGYPAQTDLMSVSVISKDGALADFLSTYLFMIGSGRIKEHLSQDDYWVVAIDKDKKIYASEGLRGRMELNRQAGYQMAD